MSLQTRAMVACGCFGLVFTGLSGRLVQLALDANTKLTDKATKAYEGSEEIFARRGEIRDANGVVLARNVPLKNVIADTSLLYELEPKDKSGVQKVKFDDRDRVASVLAKSLGLKFEDIRPKFEGKVDAASGDLKFNRYVVIKKKVSEDDASALEKALIQSKIERVRALTGKDKWSPDKLKTLEAAKTLAEANVRGVVFKQDFERMYPEGNLLAHVVGFYGYIPKYDESGKETQDGEFGGVEGIERSMDNILTGLEGRRFFQKDANGREIVAPRGSDRAPMLQRVAHAPHFGVVFRVPRATTAKPTRNTSAKPNHCMAYDWWGPSLSDGGGTRAGRTTSRVTVSPSASSTTGSSGRPTMARRVSRSSKRSARADVGERTAPCCGGG